MWARRTGIRFGVEMPRMQFDACGNRPSFDLIICVWTGERAASEADQTWLQKKGRWRAIGQFAVCGLGKEKKELLQEELMLGFRYSSQF